MAWFSKEAIEKIEIFVILKIENWPIICDPEWRGELPKPVIEESPSVLFLRGMLSGEWFESVTVSYMVLWPNRSF